MSLTAAPSSATFDRVCRLLVEHSGIALGPDKGYLVQLRLGPLARAAGCASIDEFVAALPRTPNSPRHTAIIEAMTTNETSFFRDVSPFDALRQTILPELVKKRETGRIRIWCGAASTGQEPYSIAMIIREHFPQLLKGRVEIVATDLATSILTLARAGRYSQLEVNRGLPAPLLIKHFRQEGTEWLISDEIKRMVDFRPLNLVAPWPVMQPFDIVFLRNVMIYFTIETKRAILRKMRQVLDPAGHLFLGAAETTMGIDDSFQRKAVGRASCYSTGGVASAAAPGFPATGLKSGFPARAA
jgi:chemotaxis protein methyltransferase CheR